MNRTFLFIVCLSACVSADDHFQYDISFFCNLLDRDSYNLQLSWWEWDRWNPDDLISQPIVLQPRTGKHSFSMYGSQTHDQLLSDGYQSVAYIYHDCTNDRKTVSLILTLSTLCETEHPCHYRINKDLTNNWGQETVEADIMKYNMEPFEDFP